MDTNELENELSLIEFARERGMIACRHPDTGNLYAFDKRSTPAWAEGRINVAYVTPRDDDGNIIPTVENPLAQNLDGEAIILP